MRRLHHRTLIIWVACLCLTTGGGFAAVNDPDTARRFIKQGQDFEAQKNYAGAIAAYTRAVEAAPTEAVPYVLLGWAAHLAGDNASALSHLMSANALGPKNARTLVRLGIVQRDLRQLSKAVSTLREATQLDEKSASGPNALGGCLYQTGDLSGSVAAFTTAIERAPDDPDLFRQRAAVHEKLGQKEQALADVDRGTRLAKTEPQKQELAALRQRLAVAPAAPPVARAGGIAAALVKAEKPDPAAAPARQRPAAPPPTLATPVARQIDFAALAGARYAAAVSGAQELLKLVLGPRTAEENSRLENAWAAAFDFPAPAVVAYLNSLNPLLAQFVSLRSHAALLLDQLNNTWTEAMLAAGQGNRAAAEIIMAQCRDDQAHLRTVQADLKKVIAAIEALGDMPDPAVAKHRARQLAESALAYPVDSLAEEVLGQLRRQGGLRLELRQQRRVHETGWDADTRAPFDRVTEDKAAVDAFPETIPISWADRVFFGSRRSSTAAGGTFDLGVWGEISADARKLKSLLCFRRSLLTGKIEDLRAVAVADVPYGGTETNRAGYTFVTYEAQDYAADAPGAVRPYGQAARALRAYALRDATHYVVKVSPGPKLDPKSMDYAKFREAWDAPKREVTGTTLRHTLEARATGITLRFIPQASEEFVAATQPGMSPAEVRAQFSSNLPWARVIRQKADETSAAARQDRLEQLMQELLGMSEQQRREQERQAAQAEQAAIAERSKTYERDIEAIEKYVSGLQAELARAKTAPGSEDTLRSLESQLRMQQSEIQSKRDLIKSLQTGTVVHTRTPFDDYCRGQAILQARQDVTLLAAVDRERRTQAFILDKLEPSQRGEIQTSTHEMLKAGGGMDPAKWREVNQLAYRRYQATLGAAKATADATTAMWDDRVWGAETTATVADFAFSILSGTGGYKTAGLVYSFTTSALNNGLDRYFQTGSKQEGLKRGLFEGTKTVVTGLDDRIDYACTATEAFYADPEASYRDRLQSAATAAAQKWLTNQATGFIVDALTRKVDLEQPRAQWKPTGAQAIEAAKFRQQMELDEVLARDFLATHLQWRTAALRRDLPAAELRRLAAETRRKACAVNSTYGAKVYLKYSALPVEQRAFSSVMDEVHAELIPQFQQRMAAGESINGQPIGRWGEFNVFPIRNASSAGTVSMDFDLALRQQPDWIPDGKGGLRRNLWLTRDGRPASPHEFSERAQPVWEQLYRQHTGYSAQAAFENITTLQHHEAYKDMAWINTTKAGGVDAIDPRWAQQAGDVTRVKHFEMARGQPALLHYQKLQESCRGTAKDINTKIFTQLADVEKKRGATMTGAQREHFNEVKTFWTNCEKVMADFGQGRLSPLEADRQIYLLSGGRGIADLTDRVGTTIESLGKGKKS